jgi:drug/metabolite transporter (DMT)-like permease
MDPKQILGIVALIVGVVLLGFAFNAADAPVDKISETLTGRYTDRTMWYFILGTAAVVIGGLVFLFGRRSS